MADTIPSLSSQSEHAKSLSTDLVFTIQSRCFVFSAFCKPFEIKFLKIGVLT